MTSDEVDRAEMILLSSRLASAVSILERKVKGEKLGEEQQQNLRWTADLVAKVDLNNSYAKSDTSEVLATRVRPFFYEPLPERRNGTNVLKKVYKLLVAEDKGEKEDYPMAKVVLTYVSKRCLPSEPIR